jgi:RNA polymerase sigma factor (sigma-70 family)
MRFDEVYTIYGKLVFNLALKYVQNIEDAEEITQDVFVSIHQGLSSFQQNAEMQTWIYRIVINKSLDFIKSKNRQKRFAVLTSIFLPSGKEMKSLERNFHHPGVLMEEKEAVAIIFQQINLLPANQKTALILHKLEQKSQKEVAEIMNLSTKAVESLLQRAKLSLVKKINQNEGK